MSKLIRLVLIQPIRVTGVKALLPCAFKFDYLAGFHVRRNSLKNSKSKILWVTISEEAISPMSTGSIIIPSAKKVVMTIC